jgi:hypothetical protein
MDFYLSSTQGIRRYPIQNQPTTLMMTTLHMLLHAYAQAQWNHERHVQFTNAPSHPAAELPKPCALDDVTVGVYLLAQCVVLEQGRAWPAGPTTE